MPTTDPKPDETPVEPAEDNPYVGHEGEPQDDVDA